MDIEFTAHVEAELDRVAAGEADYLAFLEQFYRPFHGRVDSAAAAGDFLPPAPLLLEGSSCAGCGQAQVLRFQRRDLIVVCTGCRERQLATLSWAPRRARRTP